MKKISVMARVSARPGMEMEVRRACLALVEPSRAEKGCINYDLHQSADDTTLFNGISSVRASLKNDASLSRQVSARGIVKI